MQYNELFTFVGFLPKMKKILRWKKRNKKIEEDDDLIYMEWLVTDYLETILYF